MENRAESETNTPKQRNIYNIQKNKKREVLIVKNDDGTDFEIVFNSKHIIDKTLNDLKLKCLKLEQRLL